MVDKKRFLAIFFLLALLGTSCDNQKKKEREIAQIPMEISLQRFDSLFFASKNPLELKPAFPYFFPENEPDSVWIEKQHDTLMQEIFSEVNKQFPSVSVQKKQIQNIFQHVKYYFPKFQTPKVLTLTSEGDYHSRMIYADTLLLIGIDNYLGAKHRFYQGVPEYLAYEFEPKFIPADVALSIAETIVPKQPNATFLEMMIHEGKILYLAHLFAPNLAWEDLLKYPPEKYQWATENEAEIWRYFIDHKLLYSTEKSLANRFISVAPFSKFYLELDNQSPGGVGRFIGLNIVRAFMKPQPEQIQQLLQTPAQQIFFQSKYKPKK